MALLRLAAALERAPDDDRVEVKLRARLTNLIKGLDQGHLALPAVERRLRQMVRSFDKAPGDTRDAVLAAFDEAYDEFREQDHYERPQAPTVDISKRAITIQRNQGGRLGLFLLGRLASGAEIVDAFENGGCLPDAAIGAPDRPLWLAPYTGRFETVCEDAKLSNLSTFERAQVVRWIIGNLGLYDYDPKDEVLAFITTRRIRDLGFDHPHTNHRIATPSGPSAIEARRHGRFRWWPRAEGQDGFGRTYALDADERAKLIAFRDYGLPEVVRPRLPLTEFVDCILLGTVSAFLFDDPDDVYLDALDAPLTSSATMLRDLHVRLGL